MDLGEFAIEDLAPDQQRQLESLTKSVDRVTRAFRLAMLCDELPLKVIERLLPLAELTWRDCDPAGALVFDDIYSPFPRVSFCRKAGGVAYWLLNNNSRRYLVPMAAVLALALWIVSPSPLSK